MAYHLLWQVARTMQSEPILCPYCATPLRLRTPVSQLRAAFDCERCGEFTDFRKVPVMPQSKAPANRTALECTTPKRFETLRGVGM
jgi:hypothetical protein